MAGDMAGGGRGTIAAGARRPARPSVAHSPVLPRVTVHALELREVAEVDGVLEGARVAVARRAVHPREVADVYGVAELAVLNGDGRAAPGLVEDGVANVALVADDAPVVGLVLAVVAAEAALIIEVAQVVGVRLPVGLHLGEVVGLVDALHLRDGRAHRVAFLRVEVWVVLPVETFEVACNRGDGLVGRLIA